MCFCFNVDQVPLPFLTDMMDTASNSVAPTTFNGATFAAALPGATAPLGYFDPLNFCSAERDAEPAGADAASGAEGDEGNKPKGWPE